MSDEKFNNPPPLIEQQNKEHNEAHNDSLTSIHNKDFERSHGYPHPSTVNRRIDIKEFEKKVADAVKKVFEKKKLS